MIPVSTPMTHILAKLREQSSFQKRIGKLTCAWEYCRYGQDFPFAWAKSLIKLGITPHLALEPDRLGDVHDDDYIHGFAKDAKLCGGPIFPTVRRRNERRSDRITTIRRRILRSFAWCMMFSPKKRLMWPSSGASMRFLRQIGIRITRVMLMSIGWGPIFTR